MFELASTPKSIARPEESALSTPAKAVWSDKAPKIQAAPYPGASRTLDRPFPNVSGRRGVPTLVNANRVPFLRIKKPQPPFLSRIIRSIVKTRNHRILNGERLANELTYAQDEDEWDRILHELAGLDSTNLLEPHWHREVKQAVDDNHQRQIGAIQRRADISAKMHAIVEKEKALAQEAKLRRRDEKHKAYKARRLARKGLGDSEIQKRLDSHTKKTVIVDAPTMTEDVLNQEQQEVRLPYREDVTHVKTTTAKEALSGGQQEDRSPDREEVTLKEPTSVKQPLNQDQQQDQPPYGEVNKPMTREEVFNQGWQEDRSLCKEEVTLDKPTTTKEVSNEAQHEDRPLCREEVSLDRITKTEGALNRGRQEDRSPLMGEEMRQGSDKFKTPDELKQVYKDDLGPETNGEIAKVDDARAREKERGSERKTQEAVRMEQKLNEEVEGPLNKRVGLEKPAGPDEALSYLKPPVDLVARKKDIALQPEVLPLLEEPRCAWSKRSQRQRVDRRGEYKLDILCQRLFQARFKDIERTGQL